MRCTCCPSPTPTRCSCRRPLSMTALSVPILKERTDARRLGARSGSASGVLIMLGRVRRACVARLARGTRLGRWPTRSAASRCASLTRTDTTASVVVWTIRVMTLMALGRRAAALGGAAAAALRLADPARGAGGGRHLRLTEAFRSAPAAVVAPLEYTALLWGIPSTASSGTCCPRRASCVGGAVVIGSGLYLIWRERSARPRSARSPRSHGSTGRGRAECRADQRPLTMSTANKRKTPMSNAEVRGRFVWHELLTTDTAAAAAFYTKVRRGAPSPPTCPVTRYSWPGERRSAASWRCHEAAPAPPPTGSSTSAPQRRCDRDQAQALGGTMCKDPTDIPKRRALRSARRSAGRNLRRLHPGQRPAAGDSLPRAPSPGMSCDH